MYKLAENVFFEKTDTESYFIDVNSGRYIYNNASSTLIIECLLNSNHLEEVTEKVSKTYTVDAQELRQDIMNILNQLQELNLIYECGESGWNTINLSAN